jgi:glycosyltransferase involved in cell wall biosynthesis
VATRVGGTPEAIVDGVTGVLVPPASSSALADAIVHLLCDTDLAGHLGHAARARIVDHFSVRRMVRSTEDLYVELLERKQRKRLPSAAC